VACHGPEKGLDPKSRSVPLGNLAEKTTQAALTQFLLDPYHARPAGRMPAMGLNPIEARAIATYLLRDQMKPVGGLATSRLMPGTGVTFEYFQETITSAKAESFAALKPKSSGKVKNFTLEIPGRREKNHFGIRYTTSLWVPRDGKYTFGIKSDDGAILWIDGKVVVDNDGRHPADKEKASKEIELKAGMHPLVLTYFQDGGGMALEVLWEGPGVAHQAVPTDVLAVDSGKTMTPLNNEAFALDAGKAQFGAQMFTIVGCANCHVAANFPPAKRPKALAQLNVDNPEGCLGDRIAKGKPNFDLSAEQREALKAVVREAASLSQPLEPAKRAIHEMAAMNCLACHQRDGIGGVPAERNEFFKTIPNVDLGDEGRIPPRLTGVGAKLQTKAIERVVFRNELHVRPYYLTRMPVFRQETLPDLPETLGKADASLDPPDQPVPHVVVNAENDGRRLVGVKGLGCVNCHGVRGVKSLGVPAPDLALVYELLRPQWFRRLLWNPGEVNPGTRMPVFWNEGESAIKDVAGGTFDGQVNAIWTYLQQGNDMSMPDGLRLNNSDEIVPGDGVCVLRAFVTGVSPRSILVGNPESVHWVFDANAVRLAKAWHGKFFDAAGIWEQRGGQARPPLGKDVIDMPPGPSFATLESAGAAWPEQSTDLFDRNIGGRFKGYVLDKEGRPTFKYELKGVEIEEKVVPKGAGEHAGMERDFSLVAKGPVKDLYFLIASGRKIESKDPGTWVIDGHLNVRLRGAAGNAIPDTEVRDGKDGAKLLVLPVRFTNDGAKFSVEMSW
jgi:mono/diheme cytochrome c family protein